MSRFFIGGGFEGLARVIFYREVRLVKICIEYVWIMKNLVCLNIYWGCWERYGGDIEVRLDEGGF